MNYINRLLQSYQIWLWIFLSGQKYAMLELKVVFANLLRKVKFSVPDPTKPLSDAPDLGFVLKPKHGLRLIVSKRLNN